MTTPSGLRFSAAKLSLCAAFLPLVTFNVCYVVAASLQHVPTCIPYLTGCTSASSTGRLPPESWLFKAGMLPLAVVVLLLWRRLAKQLEAQGQFGHRVCALRWLGIAGALSLVIYSLSLGIDGTEFRAVRRIGINGFAVTNFAAQICCLLALRPLCTELTQRRWQWLLAICLLVPAIALAAEVAKLFGAPRRPVNNIIAWNALLIQSLWFYLLSRLMLLPAAARTTS